MSNPSINLSSSIPQDRDQFISFLKGLMWRAEVEEDSSGLLLECPECGVKLISINEEEAATPIDKLIHSFQFRGVQFEKVRHHAGCMADMARLALGYEHNPFRLMVIQYEGSYDHKPVIAIAKNQLEADRMVINRVDFPISSAKITFQEVKSGVLFNEP